MCTLHNCSRRGCHDKSVVSHTLSGLPQGIVHNTCIQLPLDFVFACAVPLSLACAPVMRCSVGRLLCGLWYEARSVCVPASAHPLPCSLQTAPLNLQSSAYACPCIHFATITTCRAPRNIHFTKHGQKYRTNKTSNPFSEKGCEQEH